MQKFKNSNYQGNYGLGKCIAHYTQNEYIVSIPLNDTQDYDLIVERNGLLQKIQVKTASTDRVHLRSGNYHGPKKKFSNENLDVLFVVDTNGHLYTVPIKNFSNSSSISVNLLKEYRV